MRLQFERAPAGVRGGPTSNGISADPAVAYLDQVDAVPFDLITGVRVRRQRRPLRDRMLLAGHDPLVALHESHVRPPRVDGRDVAADGVDSLDALAGGHVLEDEVRGDQREDRLHIAREEASR